MSTGSVAGLVSYSSLIGLGTHILPQHPVHPRLPAYARGLVWAPVRICWILGGLEMQALRRLGRSAAVGPDRPMPRKPLKTRPPTRIRRVRDDGFEENEGRIYSMTRPAEFMHFQTGADSVTSGSLPIEDWLWP